MDTITASITVYYEDPFWIGVYEREINGKYEACKITFGAEPKSYDVYKFLRENWQTLKFSPVIEVESRLQRRVNPKRMQREVAKTIHRTGVGTKAQQAIKLQQEEGKCARKRKSREMKLAEREREFELRTEKRKAKHRGH